MISCKLQGGLCNQLFQIAATYALAKRNDDECCFDLDGCYTPNQGNPANKYKDSILAKIKNSNATYRVFYTEPRFGYEELTYTPNLLLEGYFQSAKYFEDYSKEIKALFSIKLANKFKILSHIDAWGLTGKPLTSIHIRRGDYLSKSDYHKVQPIEYYQKAMAEIGDSNFIFVSDDIEWVKTVFVGDNYRYSPFNNEEMDLTLMTMCDNNIIANSSFSWWGAYLNENENKKIISPKEWFGPNGPKDIQDIIPENWLKI